MPMYIGSEHLFTVRSGKKLSVKEATVWLVSLEIQAKEFCSRKNGILLNPRMKEVVIKWFEVAIAWEESLLVLRESKCVGPNEWRGCRKRSWWEHIVFLHNPFVTNWWEVFRCWQAWKKMWLLWCLHCRCSFLPRTFSVGTNVGGWIKRTNIFINCGVFCHFLSWCAMLQQGPC